MDKEILDCVFADALVEDRGALFSPIQERWFLSASFVGEN